MKRRDDYDYSFDSHRGEIALDPVNKKLGGVCSGIARYLGIPSLVIRVGTLVGLCVAPQLALIAYGLAYIILEPRV